MQRCGGTGRDARVEQNRAEDGAMAGGDGRGGDGLAGRVLLGGGHAAVANGGVKADGKRVHACRQGSGRHAGDSEHHQHDLDTLAQCFSGTMCGTTSYLIHHDVLPLVLGHELDVGQQDLVRGHDDWELGVDAAARRHALRANLLTLCVDGGGVAGRGRARRVSWRSRGTHAGRAWQLQHARWARLAAATVHGCLHPCWALPARGPAATLVPGRGPPPAPAPHPACCRGRAPQGSRGPTAQTPTPCTEAKHVWAVQSINQPHFKSTAQTQTPCTGEEVVGNWDSRGGAPRSVHALPPTAHRQLCKARPHNGVAGCARCSGAYCRPSPNPPVG